MAENTTVTKRLTYTPWFF